MEMSEFHYLLIPKMYEDIGGKKHIKGIYIKEENWSYALEITGVLADVIHYVATESENGSKVIGALEVYKKRVPSDQQTDKRFQEWTRKIRHKIGETNLDSYCHTCSKTQHSKIDECQKSNKGCEIAKHMQDTDKQKGNSMKIAEIEEKIIIPDLNSKEKQSANLRNLIELIGNDFCIKAIIEINGSRHIGQSNGCEVHDDPDKEITIDRGRVEEASQCMEMAIQYLKNDKLIFAFEEAIKAYKISSGASDEATEDIIEALLMRSIILTRIHLTSKIIKKEEMEQLKSDFHDLIFVHKKTLADIETYLNKIFEKVVAQTIFEAIKQIIK